ncbi:NeuD/PglB/VioB family sugar acetyltransferase [Formosa sp. S-31]|uniref:NeuD/PglB/VioB family sugar acetyltransferase n=1 Tax=Formosa sp. S-31 TaxID=2790949 RepID=UPI003EBCE464
MKKAVIIGAGTHGEIYTAYLKEAGIEIHGFIDDKDEIQGTEIRGVKVIGKYGDLFSKKFKDNYTDIYCPIGNNVIRQEYLSSLKLEGYNTPNYIHPSVIISPNVILGEAIYMLPGNSVMPYVTIGDYFMVNMGTTIGHHTKIGKSVFMSSGVHVGASLSIGERAFLGLGSTIMTGISKLGIECLIGAGSVVIREVPDYAVVCGNPAKVLRYKDPAIPLIIN